MAGRVQCVDCGRLFDPTAPGSMRRITGWEMVRAGGGANSIWSRQEVGSYLCPEHGAMMRAGVDRNQGALF